MTSGDVQASVLVAGHIREGDPNSTADADFVPNAIAEMHGHWIRPGLDVQGPVSNSSRVTLRACQRPAARSPVAVVVELRGRRPIPLDSSRCGSGRRTEVSRGGEAEVVGV